MNVLKWLKGLTLSRPVSATIARRVPTCPRCEAAHKRADRKDRLARRVWGWVLVRNERIGRLAGELAVAVVGQKGAESRLKAVSAIAETLHAKDVANQARVKELEAELATARAAVEVAQNGAREAGQRAEKAEAEAAEMRETARKHAVDALAASRDLAIRMQEVAKGLNLIRGTVATLDTMVGRG
jgi:predicted  nucleic acid-binding Zn-ribbon protein